MQDETLQEPLDRIEALALDVDLRLGAEILNLLNEVDDEDTIELVLGCSRLAYGRGYLDALSEKRRGKLCRDHGFRVPPAP